jgi:ribosomal protein L29
MAILRMNDLRKINSKELKEKLKDLKLELIKSQVTANKTNAKTKEIKRAVARIMTLNESRKREVGK